MTLGELMAVARVRLKDVLMPYHWDEALLIQYFNEAEREAAIRGRLLLDDTSFSIALVEGEKQYPLDEKIIDVVCATLDDEPVTGFELSETTLTLAEAPRAAGTLILHAYRLPLQDMAAEDDEPEIRGVHQSRLVEWVLRCAYLQADEETFKPDVAALHEATFASYFGHRHTANVLRKHRRKSPRVVRPVAF